MRFNNSFIPELLRPFRNALHDPDPIQEKAIPTFLQGKDLLGSAQTGHRKDGRFALRSFTASRCDPIRRGRRPSGRSSSPDRELASRSGQFRRLRATHRNAARRHLRRRQQRPRSRRCRKGSTSSSPRRGVSSTDGAEARELSTVEIFVLDEADRMLDIGLHRRIRASSRNSRETADLMFSATMPSEIVPLSPPLRDPVRVSRPPMPRRPRREHGSTTWKGRPRRIC